MNRPEMLLRMNGQLYLDVRVPGLCGRVEQEVRKFNNVCEVFRNCVDSFRSFNSPVYSGYLESDLQIDVALDSIRERKWREICTRLKKLIETGDVTGVVADLCVLLMNHRADDTNAIEEDLFKNLLEMPAIDEMRGEVLHVLKLMCSRLLYNASCILDGGVKLEDALVGRYGRECVRFLILE